MIVVTTDEIEGVQITRVAGLVRGSTVRARHIGRDIMAGLHNMVGGEIEEYTLPAGRGQGGGPPPHDKPR